MAFRDSNSRRALCIVALLMLLAVHLLTPGTGPVLAASTWALCFWFVATSNPRGVLSFEAVYLLLLALFHLGMVVPAALGVRPEPYPRWLDSREMPASLRLFSTGALSLTLGVLLGPRLRSARETSPATEAHLFGVGLGAALAGGALLWIGVTKAGLLSIAYGDYWERALSDDVRFLGFGMMLFPIGLLVAAVGATPRQMVLLGLLLALVCGPLFFVGFRGPFLVQAAALLVVWGYKSARLARWLALAVGASLLVLVPAVKMARNWDLALSNAVTSAQPLDFLFEMGGSMRALVVTCERVESRAERLWLGRSYAMAAGRLVPNVSARWTAPAARKLTPAAWATLHADPWAFEHGGGIGFSGVAEPYLNFGRAGVVVFFMILGYVIRVGNRWLAGERPFRAAIAAASFGFVLWTVRNDAMAVLRAIALAVVIVLVARCVAVLDRTGRIDARSEG
jgi:hypothetical protein